MQTTIQAKSDNPSRYFHYQTNYHARSVNIQVTQSEVESNTNMTTGQALGEVDILMDDGSYGRFHMYARIKNGRPVLEISTNTKAGNRSTVKTLTAVKRPRD